MNAKATKETRKHVVATIGYEAASVPRFLETLTSNGATMLVDVRAVAASRRPGFAKTALAANLESVGIGYLHLRKLGTPSDGRAAARSGKHAKMREIYLEHLATMEAQEELFRLREIIAAHKKVCLLCYEADHTHCHRNIIAEELRSDKSIEIQHLVPWPEEAD